MKFFKNNHIFISHSQLAELLDATEKEGFYEHYEKVETSPYGNSKIFKGIKGGFALNNKESVFFDVIEYYEKKQKKSYYAFKRIEWLSDDDYHRIDGPAVVLFDPFMGSILYLWYENGEEGKSNGLNYVKKLPNKASEIGYNVNPSKKDLNLKKVFIDRKGGVVCKWYYQSDDLFLPQFLSINTRKKVLTVNFNEDYKDNLSKEEKENFLNLCKDYNICPCHLEKNDFPTELLTLFKMNFNKY